jgi:hypothetical protein
MAGHRAGHLFQPVPRQMAGSVVQLAMTGPVGRVRQARSSDTGNDRWTYGPDADFFPAIPPHECVLPRGAAALDQSPAAANIPGGSVSV